MFSLVYLIVVIWRKDFSPGWIFIVVASTDLVVGENRPNVRNIILKLTIQKSCVVRNCKSEILCCVNKHSLYALCPLAVICSHRQGYSISTDPSGIPIRPLAQVLGVLATPCFCRQRREPAGNASTCDIIFNSWFSSHGIVSSYHLTSCGLLSVSTIDILQPKMCCWPFQHMLISEPLFTGEN